jgi:recombination protein RecA
MLWVDVDNLYFSQPDYGEQALSIAEELAKTWAFDMIIVDSVAALTPKAEVEWDMGDSHMWLQARMMSQWLRKLTAILAKTHTTIIFINQIRLKIGVMFGNPETTTGWNALKFYASQRLEIRRGEKIEENKEQVWYICKVKIIKNKIYPPFKVAEIPIKFMQGVDEVVDALDAWVALGLVQKWGAFYTIDNQKFQGKDRAAWYLSANPKTLQGITNLITKKLVDIRSGKNVIPTEQLAALTIKAEETEDNDDTLADLV